MPITPLNFSGDDVHVISRDDGFLNIEFRDKDAVFPNGFATISPETAVSMGQMLIAKGQRYLASAEPETESEGRHAEPIDVEVLGDTPTAS